MNAVDTRSSRLEELRRYGISNPGTVYWNLSAAQLVEKAIALGEGRLSSDGAIVVETGQFTGRSPKDKFSVRDAVTEATIDWGSVNQPVSPVHFDRIFAKVQAYYRGKDVFIHDACAGADPRYTLPIRVIAEKAYHALFCRNLFLRPSAEELKTHEPEFTIYAAPGCVTDPATDGTRTETAIVVNMSARKILICGTMYAGEMKKSIFGVLNFLLPDKGVMPMHCSANMGEGGKTAVFFGLSGTGKTTLSADPSRRLIGDDEHGWSDHGVFNFEGGCYAKTIKLSKEKEPEIWNAIRFETLLENVVLDPDSRKPDYDSDALTENTRAAYPIDFIDKAVVPSVGGQPDTIIFLTADAFGVLPPISKLTPEMAMYHFLSGYTAKIAGTERGLGKEPVAAFSTCFGEPFMPRPPKVYARLLGDRIQKQNAKCWLVNTGWAGGPYGVGERMSLKYTRAMVNAAVEGKLEGVACVPDPVFQVLVPKSVPGVPAEVLDARGMWKDPAAYDAAAKHLAGLFGKNFERFGEMDADIIAAGPKG